MKTGSLKAVLAAGLLALAFATPAAAQRADDMKPGQGGAHPCAGDAQSICSAFIPDRGKVASCLSKNRAKLSPACRASMGGGKSVGKSRKAKRHGRRHRRR
jgi:hypothetical protein